MGPVEIVYKVDISRSIESFNLEDFSKGTAYKSQYRMQETLNAFWGNTNAPNEPLISPIIAHTSWTNGMLFSVSFGLSSLLKKCFLAESDFLSENLLKPSALTSIMLSLPRFSQNFQRLVEINKHFRSLSQL